MRDPTRRNRNIGTEAAGWKKPSPYGIPRSGKPYYEKVGEHVVVRRWVHRHEFVFVVERPLEGFVHACTPDDIVRLLESLPAECVVGPRRLHGVVLRQPTRKQERTWPVWGRLIYYAVVGPIEGPAIFLEAQDPSREVSFGPKLSLELQAELARMEQLVAADRLDRRDRRGVAFRLGVLGLRRSLLYHTLLHEVGHWVDYLTKVVVPSRNGEGVEGALWDTYRSSSRLVEREGFANRFRDEWCDALVREGAIPFARSIDELTLQAEGLNPAWFSTGMPGEDEAGPAILPKFDPPRTPLRVPPLRNSDGT